MGGTQYFLERLWILRTLPFSAFFTSNIFHTYEFTTGIDFYIGLPEELNYRIARFFTDGNDLDGVMSILKSMTDPINRQLMWASMTGQNKIDELIKNSKDLWDVRITGRISPS